MKNIILITLVLITTNIYASTDYSVIIVGANESKVLSDHEILIHESETLDRLLDAYTTCNITRTKPDDLNCKDWGDLIKYKRKVIRQWEQKIYGRY